VTVVIVISTVIGNIGVGIMSRITRIGVSCELVGVALIVLFFVPAKRGPGAVFHTNGIGAHGGYIWPFMTSALMACYVMYGFDSAGELSEETRNPRKAAPQGIIRAMLASGIGGALLLVGALLAAPSLLSPRLGTEGLAYVIQSRLGTGLGKVLLVDVSIAILSAALAIQASASRVMFSMARDGRLPFSKQLAHVSPRRGTPALPNIVVGGLAIALLVVNLGQSALFTDITGVAVVVVYLAYLGVPVPRLISRFQPGFAEREWGQWQAVLPRPSRSPPQHHRRRLRHVLSHRHRLAPRHRLRRHRLPPLLLPPIRRRLRHPRRHQLPPGQTTRQNRRPRQRRNRYVILNNATTADLGLDSA
jgi:urea carboxylase system permease